MTGPLVTLTIGFFFLFYFPLRHLKHAEKRTETLCGGGGGRSNSNIYDYLRVVCCQAQRGFLLLVCQTSLQNHADEMFNTVALGP